MPVWYYVATRKTQTRSHKRKGGVMEYYDRDHRHRFTFQKLEEWTEEMVLKSQIIMDIHHRHENEPCKNLVFCWNKVIDNWVQV